MFQIPNKIFDVLFYGAIGAILYFVLPSATDFVHSVAGINENLLIALKDVMTIWAAVYLASRHKCQKDNQ